MLAGFPLCLHLTSLIHPLTQWSSVQIPTLNLILISVTSRINARDEAVKPSNSTPLEPNPYAYFRLPLASAFTYTRERTGWTSVHKSSALRFFRSQIRQVGSETKDEREGRSHSARFAENEMHSSQEWKRNLVWFGKTEEGKRMLWCFLK